MRRRCMSGRREGERHSVPSTRRHSLRLNNLGLLYANQGKLDEAKKIYERALQGIEEAFGLENVEKYRPTFNTIENIGDLYTK